MGGETGEVGRVSKRVPQVRIEFFSGIGSEGKNQSEN
jgi:hypothetical protein